MTTQYVDVARFARNVEWDFFCDFQTLCSRMKFIRQIKFYYVPLWGHTSTFRFYLVIVCIPLSHIFHNYILSHFRTIFNFFSLFNFLAGIFLVQSSHSKTQKGWWFFGLSLNLLSKIVGLLLTKMMLFFVRIGSIKSNFFFRRVRIAEKWKKGAENSQIFYWTEKRPRIA